MGRITIETFMESTTFSGGQFSQWRKKGKTIGWIHPGIGIYDRMAHGALPVEEEGDDGKKVVNNRRPNCAGTGKCPLCALAIFANKAIEDGAEPNETILDGGRGKASYTLLELAGRATGKDAWRTNIAAKHEFIIPWISSDESERAENPVTIITATEALGFAINRVIKSSIEDRGEKKGNPLVTPYAFKLIYNEKEIPMRKYDAQPVGDDVAKVTPDIKEIMEASAEDLGIDLDKMSEPGDVSKMMEGIESCWDSRNVPFTDFAEFYEGTSSGAKKGGKGRTSTKHKPKEEPTEDVGGEVDESSDSDMSICTECGAKVKGKFCPECGAKVAAPKGGKPSSTKGKTECEECKKMVTPNKYGRCPDCNARVDVAF